jgi:hypothetical protein
MAKRPLATDEGEALPMLPADSDLGQLIYLLEYARIRGFRLGPEIQIGNLIVKVDDLRQKLRDPGDPKKPDKEGDIWSEHGHEEK